MAAEQVWTLLTIGWTPSCFATKLLTPLDIARHATLSPGCPNIASSTAARLVIVLDNGDARWRALTDKFMNCATFRFAAKYLDAIKDIDQCVHEVLAAMQAME